MVMPQADSGAWRRRSPRRSKRRGVTLVAAILSLLLLLLLVALVASAVWTARGAAKRAACRGNLAKLVNGLQIYAEAHGALPPAAYDIENSDDGDVRLVTWKDLIEDNVGDPLCFICPADESTRAAEKSRPPESRATGFPCSYEYVWQRPARESAAEPPGGRRSASHTPPPRSGADTPVLVCRYHDTPDGRRAGWCLVAYEDGSIRWERRPPSQTQESLGPASQDKESAQVSVEESRPEGPAKRGRGESASGPASRSEGTAASHTDSGRERRSR